MKTYKVLLTRSYIVSIDAKNKEDALFFSEFYIGGERDLSNDKEKKSKKFKINDIEMTVNDACEAEVVEIG
jgi:hypothetical protein